MLTTISAVVPCLILGGINAYNLWTEHWEHEAHLPPLEARVEYPYQNIRNKNFPWGDGDKVGASVPIANQLTNKRFRLCCKWITAFISPSVYIASGVIASRVIASCVYRFSVYPR
jgi:hypothetical protein